VTGDDVKGWWADNPMTYGERHGQVSYGDAAYEMGTPEFFGRLDDEFSRWNAPLHDSRRFGRIFPYDDYVGQPVLEVGCGLGTMAGLWAANGADVTAVDLNPVAVEQTSARFRLDGVPARVTQASGGALPFPDATFAYAYSWGVLHHSPDLEGSLTELLRTIRSGGRFGIMLYHRRSIAHGYMTSFVEGWLHRERRFLSPLELASRYGDGAEHEGNPHTWPVTKDEVRAALEPGADDLELTLLGTELDNVFQLLLPGLGLVLPTAAKKPWARRLGWSLWITGRRR
jgi:SAM-dependent methyltransferase